MNGNAWTDKRVEMLKTLHKYFSAAEIAQKLGGGLSRSSVLGKIYRLGLSVPKPAPRRRLAGYTAAERIKQRADRQAEIDAGGVLLDLPPDESPFAVSFMKLNDHTCRWPINDDQYCGAETREDYPYCDRHCRLAYQPRERRAPTRPFRGA